MLFGIKRDPDNFIQFIFNDNGRLTTVGIEFPMKSARDFEDLLNRLDTYFGKHDSVQNQPGADIAQWPEDDGVEITLTHIQGGPGVRQLIFTVEYRSKITSSDRNGALGL